MNTKNFNFKEFECKCGCGKNQTHPNLILKLQEVRDVFKKPMIVNSAYRCEKHNKKIGGSPTSSHCEGLAVDIRCTNTKDRYSLIYFLITLGFKRIGVYPTFIHADIDTDKNTGMWVGK